MIDAEGAALLHELCEWAESRPLENISPSVKAVLDGSRQRQTCRHCERWRVRPASDWAPDYYLCPEANVYYGRDWVGPSATLDRAIAGELIDGDDYMNDTSPWILFRVLPDIIDLLVPSGDLT